MAAPKARPTTPSSTAAADEPELVSGPTLRVRAIAVGYYDEERKRIGDVFTLRPRRGMYTVLVRDQHDEPKLVPGPGTGLKSRVTTEQVRTLTAEEQFSPRWMEKVDATTPETVTTGNQDLRRQHQETMASKAGRAAPLTRDADRDVMGDSD